MAQEQFPNKEQIVALLNQVLADEFVLYAKTLNAHWNLTGINFYSVHKLLDEQYNDLQEIIDEVAERVRANKGIADGSLKSFVDKSRLSEAPAVATLQDLLVDQETLIGLLREDITTAADAGDAATEDLLVSLLNKHLTMAWMIRSVR